MTNTTQTKHFPGGYTTATMIPDGGPFYRVTVVTRFHSGNYLTERDERNLSEVAALGLLAFYTR